MRGFHTSPRRNDIDNAGRLIGAGMATVGLAGPGTKKFWLLAAFLLNLSAFYYFFFFAGAGIGIVFGSLMFAYSRNPTLKNSLFTYAILGFALTEAMGLFCILMAFVILFATN